jgi:hypothetical protein
MVDTPCVAQAPRPTRWGLVTPVGALYKHLP